MTPNAAPFRRPDRTPVVRQVAERLRDTGQVVRHLLADFRRARARDGAPRPSVMTGELRVASWNLHKCVGGDGRFDPARSVAVLAEIGADVVALQEADRRFGRRTGLLDTHLLERETGLIPLPVSDLPDGHGWHGNALLVRPGTRARLRRLSLPGAEPRGAVIAELDLPAGPLRLVAAHFGLLPGCRRRQSAAILQEVALGETMPTLLCGDLNEWKPGPRSSLRALEPLFGAAMGGPPSFPARLPVLSLDRILGWPFGLVTDVHVHDTPRARIASDHLPLVGQLHLGVAVAALTETRAAA
jgi:endonuclease/exonuclease/phosphatase family metal-dependent hydrolase